MDRAETIASELMGFLSTSFKLLDLHLPIECGNNLCLLRLSAETKSILLNSFTQSIVHGYPVCFCEVGTK